MTGVLSSWAEEAAADLHPRKYLFVASTGGHLAELVRIADTLNPHPESVWITFRGPQSLSLLHGKRILFVPYMAPRDWRSSLRALLPTWRQLHAERFSEVVSTGAGLALAVMAVASLLGVPRTYIESVSRTDGPSLTGRLLAALHLADLYTQHPAWASHRWRHRESVLSRFRSVPKEPPAAGRPLHVFVTLGTIRPFRFDALIDRLLAALPDAEFVWQLGVTTRDDLPGTVYEQTTSEHFERLAREADVVVTHAGVGSIVTLLEGGVHPVVVPRRASRQEHIDDHQLQISELVGQIGVCTVVEVGDLTKEAIQRAAGLRVVPVSSEEAS